MNVVDPFEKNKTIQRTAELEKYFQINHCNSTEEKSSHGTLIEEKESGCNSVEEDFDENFQHVDDLAHKHVCNICLLSLKTETKMKEHMEQHSTVIKLLSILKHC